jgi:hypothetical protein
MFFVLHVGITGFICMGTVFITTVILVSDLLDVYLHSESQLAELLENDKQLEG